MARCGVPASVSARTRRAPRLAGSCHAKSLSTQEASAKVSIRPLNLFALNSWPIRCYVLLALVSLEVRLQGTLSQLC
jgi:hypothetical protein